MAAEKSSDEVISLEDIVRGEGSPSIAGAPVPHVPGKQESSVHPASEPTQVTPTSSGEISIGEIDSILSAEDPAFSETMQQMKDDAIHADEAGEIDSLDLEHLPEWDDGGNGTLDRFKRANRRIREKLSGAAWSVAGFVRNFRTSIVHLTKDGLKNGLAKAKSGAVAAVGWIKGSIQALAKLPPQSKLMAGTVLALAIALFVVVKVTFMGRVLPRLGNEFLVSFAEVADAKFTYGPEEPMEDFNNPLLHPEHVVLLERMVVNLKSLQGGNPMGMFEFYIETATQDAAVEIKDREVEARDVVSRTLEQMPYEELVTFGGKNKLKVVLRKNLNEFLTKGRVRRIYFKSIVLKP